MKLACISQIQYQKFVHFVGEKENKTISYCEPCGKSSIEYYRPYTSVP